MKKCFNRVWISVLRDWLFVASLHPIETKLWATFNVNHAYSLILYIRLKGESYKITVTILSYWQNNVSMYLTKINMRQFAPVCLFCIFPYLQTPINYKSTLDAYLRQLLTYYNYQQNIRRHGLWNKIIINIDKLTK